MAGRSQLPVPASAFKKPLQPPVRSGRQSLAGPPVRGPLLATSVNLPAPPTTNPRQSVYRGQTMPQSTSKRLAIPGKDQRDTRSQQFKATTLQAVVQFLQAHEYPGDLSFKMLASPPAREVQAIVKALVAFIDPHYVWGKGGVKFEDEILPLLRGLKYPYTDGLTKATLQTPGSMPNMPHTLGLLHWLVNVCKRRDAYLNGNDETLMESPDVPEMFHDEFQIRVIEFDYTGKAYLAFLNGSDSYDNEDREIVERFAARNRSFVERTQALRNELDKLAAENHQLTSFESPVVKLTKMRDERAGDLVKIRAVIQKDQNRGMRYLKEQEGIRARIAQEMDEIDALQGERSDLALRVKEQNISPQEAVQMTRERDTLTRTVEELKQKVEATKRAYETLEVSWMNRGDQLDHAVEEYASLALKLDLDVPAPREQIDFTITLDLAKEPLIRSEDLKRTVRPALLAIVEDARRQRSEIADEQVRLEHELATLLAGIEQLDDDLVRLDARVASVLEEADNIRETAQAETAASDAEAAKLDKEIGNARAAAKTYGIGIKSRLHTLQIQYQEQIGQTERLKEETLKAISKNAAEIATFKETISGVLDELYLAAESN
ncbi:hypothetical protein EXIGLDRAFT_761828 [Exidia glandulosa HHB12029]|uniref:Kinetochore protein NDC80 n=1 Tax=Exidia glandulosa HHB12029 TaxID=1314781 RepID=A0A165N4W2_EXIGL|nr:hypothetical protein EXIGLDRAFT_761828 [Exidia glandulosa HHB12029]